MRVYLNNIGERFFVLLAIAFWAKGLTNLLARQRIKKLPNNIYRLCFLNLQPTKFDKYSISQLLCVQKKYFRLAFLLTAQCFAGEFAQKK